MSQFLGSLYNVGDISIQDLLAEDLTQILIRLLRLGSTGRSPENWNAALQDLQYLEAVEPYDELALQHLLQSLQLFVREIKQMMRYLEPISESANECASIALNFIGAQKIQRAFPSYRRQHDFARVWNGFVLLLRESLEHAETWSEALDEFEGLGQIALMTIHKSKGLEFHTMIFFGLDNQAWWSLTPQHQEELKNFFVAFTRARQRAFFTLSIDRGYPITWIEEMLTFAGVPKYNF